MNDQYMRPLHGKKRKKIIQTIDRQVNISCICFMKRTKALSAMSFSAYDVERRTRKGSFYAQVDTIIDWEII